MAISALVMWLSVSHDEATRRSEPCTTQLELQRKTSALEDAPDRGLVLSAFRAPSCLINSRGKTFRCFAESAMSKLFHAAMSKVSKASRPSASRSAHQAPPQTLPLLC